MSGPNSAFIGLGGNVGEPAVAMAQALRRLDASPDVAVVEVSSLYRTPPWGRTDQPDFVNAVARLSTTLSPRALLELCLTTERTLKRVRRERWGPRTVDMDILLYDGREIKEGGLEIPHPRMFERAFVMVPLAEIAPELTVRGVGAAQGAAALDASGIVRLPGGRTWWKKEG